MLRALGHLHIGRFHMNEGHSSLLTLEQAVMPAFYGDRPRFIDIMRHAIALNGSFFNVQRMLAEYRVKAYAAV